MPKSGPSTVWSRIGRMTAKSGATSESNRPGQGRGTHPGDEGLRPTAARLSNSTKV